LRPEGDTKEDYGYEKRLDVYRRHIGFFVTVIKKDEFVVAGILEEVTNDGHLVVRGNHKTSALHFSLVYDFTAREDRSVVKDVGGDLDK